MIGLALALILSTADETVVRPPAAPGPLDNPLKGWCPYTNAGPIHQPYSMVFLYVPWRTLEPKEGEYAFEKWEQSAWETPLARGKHIVFRVTADTPSKSPDLPAWLRAKGVKETPYDAHGGGRTPDYDHPAIRAAMDRLIAALGRRYNRHPRVAFIQLGLLGHWGEWHTWPKEDLFASEKTQRQVVEAFLKAFPDTLLMARYADGVPGKYPRLGYHDDMFPEDTDNGEDWSFLARMRRSDRLDTWKRAAIGGEMVPLKARDWLGPRFDHTLRMIDASHFSWVGPYGPALEEAESREFRARSAQVVRRMGYQFRLTEIRHPAAASSKAPMTIRVKGMNEGVAGFYYPWNVALAFLPDDSKAAVRRDLTVDVRTWRPGPFSLDASVASPAAPGTYRLGLGLIDPWTGRPAVAFANALKRHEGWTILSTVRVE